MFATQKLVVYQFVTGSLTNVRVQVLIANMRIRLIVLILTGLCSAATVSAMDRWAALSMIESGDKDRAVGPRGEVSRFQIRPELWPGGNPQDEQAALSVAQGNHGAPPGRISEKSHARRDRF